MVTALLLALALSADCKGSVCVETHDQRASAELTAFNRSVAEVALHVDLELQNATCSRGTSFDVELQPGSTVRLAEIRSNGGAWHYHYTTHYMFGRLTASHDARVTYRLPFATGRAVLLIQGAHGTFSHHGDLDQAWDFDLPEGTPVLAAREGTVIDVHDGETEHGETVEFADKANYVYVLHADGTIGEYLHLRPGGVRAKIGDVVQRGQLLGLSGNTGWSKGPHLHFEVNKRASARSRQTLPVHFRTAEGDGIELETGKSYTAVAE